MTVESLNHNDRTESLDDGWSNLAESVPFAGSRPIEFIENREQEKMPTLAEIRQIHIGYLSGSYEPSSEEWDLILSDESFYKSDEYNAYRKQEIDKIAVERADIYAPSDEKVRLTIEPFVDLIKQDSQRLLEIGSKLDDELSEDNIFETMKFFSEKYDIQDTPSLKLVYDGSASGSYLYGSKTINIRIDKTNSAAQYINTIAHEMWHAYQHQHEDENEEYKINNEQYYKSSMDYDAYVNQLVEKEAFAIGDTIGDLYRRVDLETHPEKIPDLRKKYSEWLSGEYKPSEVEDGIDYQYLILAHDEFAEPNPIKESAWTRLRKKFRKEKK